MSILQDDQWILNKKEFTLYRVQSTVNNKNLRLIASILHSCRNRVNPQCVVLHLIWVFNLQILADLFQTLPGCWSRTLFSDPVAETIVFVLVELSAAMFYRRKHIKKSKTLFVTVATIMLMGLENEDTQVRILVVVVDTFSNFVWSYWVPCKQQRLMYLCYSRQIITVLKSVRCW